MLEIVYGQTKKRQIAYQLRDILQGMCLSGVFYIGYPIISSADEKVEIDALLVTKDYGLIAFLFAEHSPVVTDVEAWQRIRDQQDRLYYAVDANLKRYDALRSGRALGIVVEPITVFPVDPAVPINLQGRYVGMDNLADQIRQCAAIDEKYLRPLQAALQRVTMIKPRKKREAVTTPASRGGILKEIEKEVANLDQWQKKAAIETPDGPQRIRGLAGSGKTVVLALKAAYLHAQHPDWTIAVTFQTRSLIQQFEDLIRRFSFEHINDEPNWDRLRVRHAWGSRERDGIYSEIADHAQADRRDFLYGKARYGMSGAFQGVCAELLAQTSVDPGAPLYDAVLIDEAQDLPVEFFRLVYRYTAAPKRIVWAYDELQTLSENIMPKTDELFGRDQDGRPLIILDNREGQPKQDIILPVCYRNTPWALTLAHGLGFGIYRTGGLVQHFDDPSLWKEIGYRVIGGTLVPGQMVTIERDPRSYPDYFQKLLNPADAVVCQSCDGEVEQAEWVAQGIERNLKADELEADDILIIFPSALTAKSQSALMMKTLARRGIKSHLAGVMSSTDEIFVKGSVAMAHIFRSKGNEAPMVYLLNAHYCYSGHELTTLRNILFTAITRCRAWVRISGWGASMPALLKEIDTIRSKNFQLSFRVPSNTELKALRRIHRDRTEPEKEKIRKTEKDLESFLQDVQSGNIAFESLPVATQDGLRRLVNRRESVDDAG